MKHATWCPKYPGNATVKTGRYIKSRKAHRISVSYSAPCCCASNRLARSLRKLMGAA